MNEVKPAQHIETQIRAHVLTTCWGICKEKKPYCWDEFTC